MTVGNETKTCLHIMYKVMYCAERPGPQAGAQRAGDPKGRHAPLGAKNLVLGLRTGGCRAIEMDLVIHGVIAAIAAQRTGDPIDIGIGL